MRHVSGRTMSDQSSSNGSVRMRQLSSSRSTDEDELDLEGQNPPLTNKRIPVAKNRTSTTSSSAAPSQDMTILALLIVAWYASSVVCTNTSKSLKLPWRTLTFCQMVLSSLCGMIGIGVGGLGDGSGKIRMFPSKEALGLTVLLSLSFSAGFVTLNASLAAAHVSTVMTLRAAEPVATWILGLILLPEERSTWTQLLSLLPIVLGAALSASTSSSTNGSSGGGGMGGFAIVMLCNACFALRTLLTKRLKAKFTDVDNYTLFLQLCVLASLWQGILWIGGGGWDLSTSSVDVPVLLLNGLTFYLYLQLSWVVMGRIGAVTHSVCNALRRPVICASGWFLFGGATLEGILGVILATAGTMLYARAKRQAATSN